MARETTHFLKLYTTLTGGVLLGLALFNACMDPYGAYPKLCPSPLARWRNGLNARTGKAERVLRFTGDTVVLGTSRAEAGIDPLSPEFAGYSVLNAALAGSNMYETRYVADLVLRQPSVKRVLLFVDFHQFTTQRTTNHDFRESLFNPNRGFLEYHGCNLLGLRTTIESLKSVRNWKQSRPPQCDITGFRRAGLGARLIVPHLRYEKVLGSYLDRPDVLREYIYGRDRVDMLQDIITKARQREIEVCIAITPIHETMLEAIRQAELWETFEGWKRDLVDIAQRAGDGVKVWDFTGPTHYTTEPIPLQTDSEELNWFWESSHCRAELGDKVLQRLFNHADADPALGSRIDSSNIESHLAALKFKHDVWRSRAEDDARLVRKLAIAAGFSGDVH